MARQSRSRAAAAALQRVPTPQVREFSDEEPVGTPQEDISQDDELDDQVDVDGDDDRATPAVDSDAGSAVATPASGRGGARRKRGGRVKGAGRRRDLHNLGDNGSDAGTPKRRGGWRGRGFGGGRWAKAKGGPSHVTQVPLDKEGNMANVVNDEVQLPEDSEGEQKVTKDGELLGDRQYRVRTFKIEGKGERLYMLSTEPARCIGFRDSYLFFQKHKQLYKIIIAEEAKKDLIDRGLIPHSYKGRAIGVVTARSVFREFGAKIVVGGKKVTDDYRVAEARARGDPEGEYAVPEDDIPPGTENYDRNRYVAWHGASSVYHTGVPSVPLLNGKPVESKKRKVVLNDANWMYEHAVQANRFNSAIAMQRRRNCEGVYNVHTNFMQYPKIMQATHARWQQVLLDSPNSHVFGTSDSSTGNFMRKHITQNDSDTEASEATIFSKVPPVYARKFMITDTQYETPSTSTLGYPGADEALIDVNGPGLAHVPEHIIAELPSDCRQEFFKARAQELEWKSRWRTEEDDTTRAALKITYNG